MENTETKPVTPAPASETSASSSPAGEVQDGELANVNGGMIAVYSTVNSAMLHRAVGETTKVLNKIQERCEETNKCPG